MKNRTRNILFVILFLAGLSLLLYPFISNEWNTYRQKQILTSYKQVITEQEESGAIDYEKEWEKAEEYNERLLPSILPDSFAVAAAAGEPAEEYMNCLNLGGDGMMGYVEIPKIDISIPIYHTTSEEILQIAAGHLEGSSLPIGGVNTHSVISAHRGLPSAELFTDLDQLEVGDHFLLHVLNEILCYEVDQISVVEPDDTEALAVEDGNDFVTLLTCTPYGVNTHRLLVRGHSVEYVPEIIAEEDEAVTAASFHTNYLLWVFVGLGLTGAVIIVLYVREKQLKRKLDRSS